MKNLMFIIVLALMPVKVYGLGWFFLGMAVANSGSSNNKPNVENNNKSRFIEAYDNNCEDGPFMIKVTNIRKISRINKVLIKRGGLFSSNKYGHVDFTGIYVGNRSYPFCIKESYEEAKSFLLKSGEL